MWTTRESPYALTSKSNELLVHTVIYMTSRQQVRFLIVYGSMGRPDMAYFEFTDKYFAGEPIKIFNNGDFENDLYHDFTYIDDIVAAIGCLLNHASARRGQLASYL